MSKSGNTFRYIHKSTVKTYMSSKISLHFCWNDHLLSSRFDGSQIILQLI